MKSLKPQFSLWLKPHFETILQLSNTKQTKEQRLPSTRHKGTKSPVKEETNQQRNQFINN